jgi:protein-S-isoprenylcysteine O-methyltransferase Ste14
MPAMSQQLGTAQPARPVRRALGLAVVLLLLVAAVFLPARRPTWPAGWACVALVFAGLVAQDVHVRRRNPGLLERRRRSGAGTPAWDRAIVACAQVLTPTLFVVSALDGAHRHPVFPPLPVWLAGLALWAAGQTLVAWAMGANAFFEGTIRLQADVDHTVVRGGPYRYVRHPGYVGFLLYFFAIPLLLGSAWGLPVAALVLVWLLPRTIAEDRFLQRNLPGYGDYARQVRWRWVPGVW